MKKLTSYGSSLMAMFLMIGLFQFGFAQEKGKEKVSELKIKTSAVCGMCKDKIEKALAFEKGVKSSDLDVDTKICTVTYRSDKTTPDKIRAAISKAGYDADNVPANAKAYEKLPACCKKDASAH